MLKKRPELSIDQIVHKRPSTHHYWITNYNEFFNKILWQVERCSSNTSKNNCLDCKLLHKCLKAFDDTTSAKINPSVLKNNATKLGNILMKKQVNYPYVENCKKAFSEINNLTLTK